MIRDAARRSPRVRALYHGLRGFVLSAPSHPADLLPELQRLDPASSRTHEARLNLLIGTVNPQALYAGGVTALRVFQAIADRVDSRRRIVSFAPVPADQIAVRGYVPTDIEDEGPTRSLVSAAGRKGARLPVGARDAFVATYWSTAEAALRVREWQRTTHGIAPPYFVYIIQDYEPGFFPLSAQFLLAQSTYESKDQVIAVFNTSLLQDYFHAQGLTFAHEFAFEPRLPAELRTARDKWTQRDRTIVVYGRPHTPRNAFPLIVEGLRRWHEVDPRATSWKCVSAGEPHEPVDLGGVQLRSLGKLDMATYGRLLARSAVGISLMVSPHPSYPPLEMAHLGMLVITNRFDDKDLASWHDNITNLADVTPEGIASTISLVCSRFDMDPTLGERGQTRRPEYLSDDPQFPFAEEVAQLLMGSVDGTAQQVAKTRTAGD